MTSESAPITIDDYRRMAFLLESLPAAVLTSTMDGQLVNLSPQFKAITGYDKNTLGLKKLSELIDPDLKAEFDGFFENAKHQQNSDICGCITKLVCLSENVLHVAIGLRRIRVMREKTGLSDDLFNVCILPIG